MVGLLVGAQVLALVAMVAVSAWGWTRLDPETRIRARTGTSGFDYTMSKNTALLWTPLIGLVVVGATIGLPRSSEHGTIASVGLGDAHLLGGALVLSEASGSLTPHTDTMGIHLPGHPGGTDTCAIELSVIGPATEESACGLDD